MKKKKWIQIVWTIIVVFVLLSMLLFLFPLHTLGI